MFMCSEAAIRGTPWPDRIVATAIVVTMTEDFRVPGGNGGLKRVSPRNSFAVVGHWQELYRNPFTGGLNNDFSI
jgi:hypothetical protein